MGCGGALLWGSRHEQCGSDLPGYCGSHFDERVRYLPCHHGLRPLGMELGLHGLSVDHRSCGGSIRIVDRSGCGSWRVEPFHYSPAPGDHRPWPFPVSGRFWNRAQHADSCSGLHHLQMVSLGTTFHRSGICLLREPGGKRCRCGRLCLSFGHLRMAIHLLLDRCRKPAVCCHLVSFPPRQEDRASSQVGT